MITYGNYIRIGAVLAHILVCNVLSAVQAEAHPVAQGTMEVVVFSDRVNIRATVSNEEVLVAATMGGEKALSLLEMAHHHSEYLLKHLHVTADGSLLEGHIVTAPSQAAARFSYEFEYRLGDSRPKHIGLQQDVLREWEFAPGNRWEASYLVRIGHDGQPIVEDHFLTFRQPVNFECHWPQVLGAPSTVRNNQASTATAFVFHGFMHILTGYDHLLFLGALLLATVNLFDLILVVTAFTCAHTLTLVLAALDVFRLSEGIVEPVIAASIVVVALQNVFWPQQTRGRSRIFVAFLFGLFHGLGFAGGLLDAMSSLQGGSATTALVAFSVGVEAGHQVVILPVFMCLRLLRHATSNGSKCEASVSRFGSAGIALAGVVYLVAALL